jgi:hypothetical protein
MYDKLGLTLGLRNDTSGKDVFVIVENCRQGLRLVRGTKVHDINISDGDGVMRSFNQLLLDAQQPLTLQDMPPLKSLLSNSKQFIITVNHQSRGEREAIRLESKDPNKMTRLVDIDV